MELWKLTSNASVADGIRDGRILDDTLDEIRLTLSLSSLVLFTCVDQVYEQQQVLDAHSRSTPAHYPIRIRERGVRPIYWY